MCLKYSKEVLVVSPALSTLFPPNHCQMELCSYDPWFSHYWLDASPHPQQGLTKLPKLASDLWSCWLSFWSGWDYYRHVPPTLAAVALSKSITHSKVRQRRPCSNQSDVTLQGFLIQILSGTLAPTWLAPSIFRSLPKMGDLLFQNYIFTS